MSVSLADLHNTVETQLRSAGCVFAEDEARLLISSAKTQQELAAMLDQRVAGLPLEHILGWAEFLGLRIALEPGVFVPRRRTEFLAQQAITLAPSPAIIVDLCCGSGALGVALINNLNQVELHATDIVVNAVRSARRNIPVSKGQTYLGNLYDPLPDDLRGRVDVVVANAPYVPTQEIELLPAEARAYEPRIALDGGADGLEIQRKVVAEASQWLTPPYGHLLIETSDRQAALLAEIFADQGFNPQIASSDEVNATIVIGSRTG